MALAARAFGPRLVVLTVDHGLRPEAAGECAGVASLATGLGLEAAVLRAELRPGEGPQARARTARYRALGAWCSAAGVPVLMTAHHAGDQAETFLMRAARGSGVGGLAGIRPSVDLFGVRVVRPLLQVPRAALAAIVAAQRWQPVDDPSNRDPRFDRTAARRLLADTGWLDAGRLAASAAHLAAAEEALGWAAEAAWRSRVVAGDHGLRLDCEGLPAELQRRLIGRAVAALGAGEPEGTGLDRLHARLLAGAGGTIAGVRARVVAPDHWAFSLASPRRVQQ
jgi:tRNA(Ile)-lysidine synthase